MFKSFLSLFASRAVAGFSIAGVLILGVFLANQFRGDSDWHKPTTVTVTSDVAVYISGSPVMDWTHGQWVADDVAVPLDCPSEDSCTLVSEPGGTWVVKAADPELVVSGQEAQSWTDPGHGSCVVALGDTSRGVCADGHTFSS